MIEKLKKDLNNIIKNGGRELKNLTVLLKGLTFKIHYNVIYIEINGVYPEDTLLVRRYIYKRLEELGYDIDNIIIKMEW